MSCLVDSRVELIGFAVEAMNFANGDTDNMKEKRSAIPDKQLIRLIVEAADPSRRLQDQRTRMPFTDQEEVFMDLVGLLQSRRMDDQRATLANLPSSSSHTSLSKDGAVPEPPVTEEEFVELLFRCQSCRINDQRSPDPETYRRNIMPGEDFFNLLQHLQSTRIEDQRSPFPF